MKRLITLLLGCMLAMTLRAQSLDVAADFADAAVIYVSYETGTDDPSSGGSDHPYQTLRYAIEHGVDGKTWVKVAANSSTQNNENGYIELKDNILIDGGYDRGTWQKMYGVKTNVNISYPAAAVNGYNTDYCYSEIGFYSDNRTGWVLRDLNVNVDNASGHTPIGHGATVYGIYVAGTDMNAPQARLIGCTITAGSGAPGSNGDSGGNGRAGNNGGSGSESTSYNTSGGANIGSGVRQGGAGGRGGAGGAGSSSSSSRAGKAGDNGSSGANGSGTFRTNKGNADGGNGSYGSNGNNGSDGTNSHTATWNRFFQPAEKGGNGSDGQGGQGGGGGGGGNGYYKSGWLATYAYTGGSGGRGGSGGEGGQGGSAGASGGGSFAIYCYNAQTPSIWADDNTLISGNAGAAGVGGNGGNGGNGGSGGSGGDGGSGILYSAHDGGNGGSGGKGGNGGKGADGKAGESHRIAIVSNSTLLQADIASAISKDVVTCSAGQITLTAVPGYGGNTCKWYTSPTDMTASATGDTYTLNISEPSTYYVASYNTETGAESPASDRRAVNVRIEAPTVPAITGNCAVCNGDHTLLQVDSPENGIGYRWFADADCTQPIATSTTYTTPALTQDVRYYLYAQTTSGEICRSSVSEIMVTVKELPTISTITADSSVVCSGGSALLSVETDAEYVRWHSLWNEDELTGTSVTINYPEIQDAESADYITVMTAGIRYEAEGLNCSVTQDVSVTVRGFSAGAIQSRNLEACASQNSAVNIHSTDDGYGFGAAQYEWRRSSTSDFTSYETLLTTESSTYTIHPQELQSLNPDTDEPVTYYYRRFRLNPCTGAWMASDNTFTLRIRTALTQPSIATNLSGSEENGYQTDCGGNAMIAASHGDADAENIRYRYFWYSDPNGENLIAVTDTLNTGLLWQDTTFYVQAIRQEYLKEIQEFSYSGRIQTMEIPDYATILTLEAWGAQGGYRTSADNGGKGGYTHAVMDITAGSVPRLYIGVGGHPGHGNYASSGVRAGGYNGGGYRYGYYGGGGATHIALRDGLLQELSSYPNSVLVVAGGGGSDGAENQAGADGAGGNSNGCSATGGSTYSINSDRFGSGGNSSVEHASSPTYTNLIGYSTSMGTDLVSYAHGDAWKGGFGFGGAGIAYEYNSLFSDDIYFFGGAGGAGYYGGCGVVTNAASLVNSTDKSRGGGGGSGYINTSAGARDNGSANGVRSGNGYARITAEGWYTLPCPSVTKPVHITVRPLPAPVLTDAESIYCGTDITLYPIGGIDNRLTYIWYGDAQGIQKIAEGLQLNVLQLSSDTTFYLRAHSTPLENGTYLCRSGSDSVRIEIMPIQMPIDIISDVNICQGEMAELYATSDYTEGDYYEMPLIAWYDEDGIRADTSASDMPWAFTPTEPGTYTFYASAVSDIISESGSSHLHTAPTGGTSAAYTGCFFDLTSLRTSIIVDSLTIHPLPNQNVMYKLRVFRRYGSCEGHTTDATGWEIVADKENVRVTGEDLTISLDAPVTVQPSRTVSFLVISDQMKMQSERNTRQMQVIARDKYAIIEPGYATQSLNFTADFPTYTTTYEVCYNGSVSYHQSGELRFGCESSERLQVQVIVDTAYTAPTTITMTADTVCFGESVTLVADGSINGTSWYEWYQDGVSESNRIVTSKGNTLTITPDKTSDYYVRISSQACGDSEPVRATVFVNTTPEVTLSADAEYALCANQPLVLEPVITLNGHDRRILSQGWEISSNGHDFTELADTARIPYAYNGSFIRYYAESSCGIGYSDTVMLIVHPDHNLAVTTEESDICPSTDYILRAHSDVADASYEWSSDTEAGLSDLHAAETVCSGAQPGTHHYTITVSDSHGCSESGEISVTVHEEAQQIHVHTGLCYDGATFYWDVTDSVYSAPTKDTLHIPYTSGIVCDSITYFLNINEGEPYLRLADEELSGDVAQTLSTTLSYVSDCPDIREKLAISYQLFKDDAPVANPSQYGNLRFSTYLPRLDRSFVAVLTNGIGEIPSCNFRIHYYHYDFIYADFAAQTENTISAQWNAEGEYKLVFNLYRRESGQDFPATYINNLTMGGAGSHNGILLASDTLVMKVTTPTVPLDGPVIYNLDEFVCADNMPFTFNGHTFTESGNYTFAGTTDDANDTIVNLTLNIIQPSETDFTAESCGSYDWNGTIYTESGDYTQTLTAENGCDSIVTLHLTISQPARTAVTATSCGSHEWNGTVYTESGDFTQTFTAENGCDSIVTLHLTVFHPAHTEMAATSCESHEWNGAIYTESGNYEQSFTAENGCDSVVTLHLSVKHGTFASQTENVCGSFDWNGISYNTDGIYTYSYTNNDGCPSTDTLHLTVILPVAEAVSESVCGSYVWNGTVYTESGDYEQTFTAANGCDSVVTLHLTVSQPASTEVAHTSCESLEWNETVYTESGDYIQSFTAWNGCDSIVTLHLTVNHGTFGSITEAVCGSFEWNGTVFDEDGIYTFSYENPAGCPSTDTLYLTIYPTHHVTENREVSASELPYLWNGVLFTSAGTQTAVLENISGCDSTVAMTLTVSDVTGGGAFMTVEYTTDTSAILTLFANETPLSDMVSINYHLYKNGNPVSDVPYECGGNFHIGTVMQGYEYGTDLNAADGNMPRNTFQISNYHYEYFYLAFLNGRENIVTHNFTTPASYEIVFELVSEEGGMDFPIPYDNNFTHRIGGKNSETGTDVLCRQSVYFEVERGRGEPQSVPSGIGEKEYNGMQLYPNPANSRVVLTLDEAVSKGLILVTDVNGKEVYRTSANGTRFELNADRWPDGVYFVTLRDAANITTKRLIIIR